MATKTIPTPEDPFRISRRDLISGAVGSLPGALLGAGVHYTAAPERLVEVPTPLEIEVDPFWTEEIWEDGSQLLRRPGTEALDRTRGRLDSPALVRTVEADSLRTDVQLYHYPDAGPRFQLPAEVSPAFERGPLCLVAHLHHFNVSRSQLGNRADHATFRFDIGSAFDDDTKFGLLVSGLNWFRDPSRATQSELDQDLLGGQPPLIVPEGEAQLKFNFWRHKPKSWWSKVLGFIVKGVDLADQVAAALFPTMKVIGAAKEVISVLNKTLATVEGVDNAEKKRYDYIWKDKKKKFALTREAKARTGWDLSLRPGLWVVIDTHDDTRLELDSDLFIHPQRFHLARRSAPDRPVLQDFNYLVWKCHLLPGRLAQQPGCIVPVE